MVEEIFTGLVTEMSEGSFVFYPGWKRENGGSKSWKLLFRVPVKRA